MAIPRYIKPKCISLRDDKRFDESWVQARLAEDPSLLQLGELKLVQRERRQERAGRVDLLFEDADGECRYVVEVQLGRTDEAHIIRCIEYWDIEQRKRRTRDLKHYAVLVAEDVTSRFLNVVRLFNGHIPIIAIQLSALEANGEIMLHCTKVVDESIQDPDADEQGEVEEADRKYWDRRVPTEVMSVVDWMLALVQEVNPSVQLNYNLGYIGMLVGSRAKNFLVLSPKQDFCRVSFYLPQSEQHDQVLKASGLEVIGYKDWGCYQVRVRLADKPREATLRHFIKAAYDDRFA